MDYNYIRCCCLFFDCYCFSFTTISDALDTFLTYMDEWDASIKSQVLSNAEKKTMKLSPETLSGLRMTSMSWN